MSTKLNFSLCDEEKIIDFVKNNEVLYNVRHAQFRDTVRKNLMWSKLAKELNAEIEDVKKKWANMRDYFIRSQTKKSTGNPSTFSKRDEAMMFLLDTSILKRKTVTNVSMNEAAKTSLEEYPELYLEHAEITDEELELSSGLIEATDGRDPRPSPFTVIDEDDRTSSTSWTDSRRSNLDVDVESPQCSRKKKRTTSDPMTELMREFISSRKPNSVEFLQPKPKSKEPLEIFFESIYSTVRTFPPKSIAKLKMKISQIVGDEEIALADQEESE